MLAAFALVSQPCFGIQWSDSDVESDPGLGRPSATAVDHGGRTHVVYTFENADDGVGLRHAIQHTPGGSWTILTIRGNSGSGKASQVSLAADADGFLHLSYVFAGGTGSGILTYRSKSDLSGWGAPVGIDGDVSLDSRADTSIGIQSNGRPAIAYSGLNGGLYFASQQPDDSWETTEVDGGSGSGFHPSLALNGPFLRPVAIAHHDADGDDLRLSELVIEFGGGSPTWQTTTIDDTGNSGWWASLARKPTRSLAVAYFQAASSETRVRYAGQILGGSVFIGQTVDSAETGTVGRDLTLRIDPVGNPVLAYIAGQPGGIGSRSEVRSARRVYGGNWEIEDVARAEPSEAVSASMDTNGAGAPVIAHAMTTSGDDSDLVVTRPAHETWVFSSLEPADVVTTTLASSAVSLAIDPAGGKHLCADLLSSLNGHQLYYVDMSRETPARTAIPDTASSTLHWTSTAIAIDPSGVIHMVGQRSGAFNPLHYFRYESGAFSPGTNLTGGGGGGELQMASDAHGNLHLALPHFSGNVRYGFLAAGSTDWVMEPVADSDDTQLLSLATSPGGTVGVSGLDTHEREVVLFTRAVGASGDFTRQIVRSLVRGDADPLSTSLVYLGNSPRIAYAPGREVVVSRPSLGHFAHTEVASFPELVEVGMAAGSCNRLHLFYAYPYNDSASYTPIGQIVHDQTAGTTTEYELAAPPGLRTENLNLRVAPGLDGMLQTAFTMLRDPEDMGSTQVVVARPADSLDLDGDSLSLVRENAHALDPSAQNTSPGSRSFARIPDPGEVFLSILFRHPNMGPDGGDSTRFDIGEFSYRTEFSPDLRCFDTTPPAGAIPSRRDAAVVGLGVSETELAYLLDDSFVGSEPRGFLRLSVRRLTPGTP